MSTTLARTTARDRVRRTVTERILAGHYRPGDRLVELHLARELGVSQGPVREALCELAAARLVESAPNRGTRVRAVSEAETREAYLARGLLEEAAAPGAALGLAGNTARLREECEAIVAAAAAGDLAGQAARNTAFHRLIVCASGNAVLLRLWDSLAFEARTHARLSAPGSNPLRAALTHLPIVEALDRGDGALAGRLLREHAESFAPPLVPLPLEGEG